MSVSKGRACLISDRLATFSVHGVIAWLLNGMFFLPDGDQYLKPLMLISILLCLWHRWRTGDGALHGLAVLLWPMVLYTAVLIAAYLVNGGFESTIRMFLFCSVFIYAAASVRLHVHWIAAFCVIGAVEMLWVIFDQGLREQLPRLHGHTNPIFFGMFAFSASVLSFCLLILYRNIWWRLVLSLVFIVFFTAAVLTQSRGVMIAAIPLGILLSVLMYRQKLFARHWSALFILAVVMTIGSVVVWKGVDQRFYKVKKELTEALSDTGSYRSSEGFRILMWRFSLDVAMKHPIFGAGNDKFQQYKQQWIEEGRYPEELISVLPGAHAHNQYLQDLAHRGGLGLTALLVLLIVPARRGLKLVLGSKNPLVVSGGYLLLGITVSYAVFSLTEVGLKHPEKIALFALLCFVALVMGRAPKADGDKAEPV